MVPFICAQFPAHAQTPTQAQAQPQTQTTTQAQALPSIDLQDLNGGHHKLADYKGKIVLLNFWATYCVPCAAEMPLLAEMQKRYKGKIVVLAASIDDPADRNKLKGFLKKHQAGNLTLMVGPTLDTLSDLQLSSLPDTLFFDADGKLVGKSVGALKRPDLQKKLAEMTHRAE
ncbi:MAG TPA: TlpA disulfide reductase family protein [Candidatus Angelobacter sp.]|nr:TlpA disulfide reductase family protein [Candidatus Angelobacter sp.]